MPAHEYHFTYYFKFQRHHFNVLLSIKERRCLKPCKDNAALSTILRRCSDVLITKSISQQYNNGVLTSITTWFYQQHNNVAWTSFKWGRFYNVGTISWYSGTTPPRKSNCNTTSLRHRVSTGLLVFTSLKMQRRFILTKLH